MSSQEISSSANCNLVFYTQQKLPKFWDASPQGSRSSDIQSLVLDLMKSPLFGRGECLGPRFYQDHGLKQVPFHKSVCDEPVFFWDKDAKKIGEIVPDKIIIRGANYVEGKWVVYYSLFDSPTLYGILYSVFKERVTVHHPQSPPPEQYTLVMGGPNLSTAIKKVLKD